MSRWLSKEFGVRPNDIHLNDGFAHQWGWYSYNHLGDVKLTNVRIEPKSSSDNGRDVINGDNAVASHRINLMTTMSNSATTTVSSKSDISTTGTITVGGEELGLGAEFSNTFTFSNEVGSTHTKSSDITVGDLVIVSLPPHTKTRVYLNVTWTSKTADWAIPVTIDPNGYTGVDFGRKVRDHYYWGSPHALLADPPFQSMMRGRLDASYDTKGVVVIEKPTPL